MSSEQPPSAQGLVLGPNDGHPQSWVDQHRGAVSFRTLFSSDLTRTTTLTTGVAELEAGASFNVHRHTPVEVYFVLAGEATMTLGSSSYPATAGTSIFVPSRVWHGIRNTGSAVLRFYYVLAADAIDDVDYDFPAPPP